MNFWGCPINRSVSHFGGVYKWGYRNLIATLGWRLESI